MGIHRLKFRITSLSLRSSLALTAKLPAASEELNHFVFNFSALLRAAGISAQQISGPGPFASVLNTYHVVDCYSCLQESKDSVAVRVALGETELVQEIRRFLIENGVSLDSFSQVRCLP